MMKLFLLFISLLFLLSASPTITHAQEPYLWWEGENPVETNFPASTWFSTGAIQGKRHLLSGGQWLTNDGNRSGAEAFATYQITVAEAAAYDLWARKFWKHGPFTWRFDDGDWHTIGSDISLADSVEIVTHLSANWVYLGKVDLESGEHVFEIRLLAKEGESETACFDCFLLTQIPFTPRGKLKPNEKSGDANPGFFSWEPPYDMHRDDALLDLRSLNETKAGQSGFVKRDGGHFILGDGEKVRFWGVNASSGIAGLERGSIVQLAKLLAKRGVNIVRYHSPLFDSSDPMQVNPKTLDNLFFLIKAMKDEGIYTTLSFYFPLWFDIKPHYNIPGYDTINNNKPFALLYFDERMQEIYKSWAAQLLTTANPYTGKPLADEPAIALIEILNEDSYFFWTFTKNNVPAVHWQNLESLFGDWLRQKYGSLEGAYTAWNNKREAADNLEEGRMALYEAWTMTGDGVKNSNAAKVKRIGDQVQFLTENQRGFYAMITDFFRTDLGAKSMITTSNWHVTDPFTLGALERYTYMVGDAIDRHGYAGGAHQSNDGSHAYSVRVGHTFANKGGVVSPNSLPLQFIQIEDYPHLISEIGWTNPDLYRADYSFLASAYGSLQGVDAFFAFALGGTGWDTSMKKFALSSPVVLGNFPAYALMYRRGDVKTAGPVIRQILDLNQLYAMKGSGDLAEQSLDDFRLVDVPPGGVASGEVKNIDPLSFYVGQVLRTFEGNPADSVEMNLTKFIDKEKKEIQSLTGELFWNYGDGLATINTPKSQGAAGFLAQAGPVQLANIAIDCGNEYATLIATSLDAKSLPDSGNVLVQAMTVERPYGFKASNGKEGTIENMGSYPIGVEKIQAEFTITSNRKSKPQVIALDENGYPRNQAIPVQVSGNGQTYTFTLLEDSVYYILQWEPLSSIKMAKALQ
jgi:hypothetical protein